MMCEAKCQEMQTIMAGKGSNTWRSEGYQRCGKELLRNTHSSYRHVAMASYTCTCTRRDIVNGEMLSTHAPKPHTKFPPSSAIANALLSYTGVTEIRPDQPPHVPTYPVTCNMYDIQRLDKVTVHLDTHRTRDITTLLITFHRQSEHRG